MIGFHETRFPEDISFGSSGGPEYSTDVVIMNSGYEQRNINWQESRAVYNIAHGVKTKDQLDELISFFRARKGRAYGFRFKDWSDYEVVNQKIAIGDGEKSEFQLIKVYSSADINEVRVIRKPVTDTIKVYINNVLYQDNLEFDIERGLIKFENAPPNDSSVSVDFQFDVPVRFDTDRLSARLDDYGVSSWTNIPLIEIRV